MISFGFHGKRMTDLICLPLQLMKEPADLDFTLELLSVEQPEEYKKEAWQMDAGEKAGEVPALRDYSQMTSRKTRTV